MNPDERLDKELQFHLDQHIADLVARGVEPGEARRRARMALGGPEQVKEECRDARRTRWLEDFVQDVRYALRTLRQRPSFAAVALLTLSLGIGATTVMFTVVDGVLLKPFAYHDPGRLLRLQERTDYSTHWGDLWGFTYPNFADCRRDAPSLDMLAWIFTRGTVTSPAPAEHEQGLEVTSNFFWTLGTNITIGRDFTAQDDHPGATPVVVISHAYWQRRYGSNTSALGSRFDYDGISYTVIGITPPSFRVEGDEFPFYTLIGQDTGKWREQRGAHALVVWARLHRGATAAQARAELAVVGRRLQQQSPDTNKGRTFIANPLRPDVDAGPTRWMLLAGVGMVLLIACANIASLMLARAVSRERELAMRYALGAGRGRIVRQCLTESSVIALAGGALGVILAIFGVHPFIAFWPGELDRSDQLAVDWRVLLFALAVSLASGLVFGLAPAFRAGARTLQTTFRAGSRSLTATSRRLHAAFVACEIAIALVLLTAAGMLGQTLLRLSAKSPGFDTRNVLTARTALSPKTLENADRTRAAWNEILDRLRHIPGVEAAATVDTVPLRRGENPVGYRTSAAPVPDDQQPLVLANSVSPDYLNVMRIPLVAGRFIAPQDVKGSENVVVIDEVMARQAFPGENPNGKHLWGIVPDPQSSTVVGVVGHIRQWGATDDDQTQIRPQLYYAFGQIPDSWVHRWSDLMSIALRTPGDPMSIIEPARREIRGATGDQVIYEINTMEHLLSASLAQQRFLLFLFAIFSALALLLASTGIYGVLAYLTSQRTAEIGIRMALGANAGTVVRLIISQSLAMLSIGIVIGLAAAIATSRVLIPLVAGMRQTSLSTFALTTSILITAALLAGYLPARRASRIDPMKALGRSESKSCGPGRSSIPTPSSAPHAASAQINRSSKGEAPSSSQSRAMAKLFRCSIPGHKLTPLLVIGLAAQDRRWPLRSYSAAFRSR